VAADCVNEDGCFGEYYHFEMTESGNPVSLIGDLMH
jgi:hypothetical protein